MREGWSIKDAGLVLGVHPNKVPQAIRPALMKIARLMLADPFKTWLELQAAMEVVRRELKNRSDPSLLSNRRTNRVLYP